MKKYIALGTFLAIFSPVNAGNFYVTLSGGISSPKNIYIEDSPFKGSLVTDDAFNGEFGIGYDFENTIRTDITYSRSKHDWELFGFENGDAEISNISFNIYKDFELDNSKFTPYVGAGIGSFTMDLRADAAFLDSSDSSISYQFKVGSSYSVSKKAKLFLEGTYLKASELTFEELNVTSNPDAMTYKAGFRYTF